MSDARSDYIDMSVTVSPNTVALIMTVLVFLAPFAFGIDPPIYEEVRLTIISLTWQVILTDGYTFFGPMSMSSVVLFPIVFFRLGFAHQLYRCYQGLVSKTRAVAMGVLAELPVFIIMALTVLPAVGTPYADYVPTMGPIPHLLLFGLILLILVPPVEPQQWIEELPSSPNW